MVENNKPVTTSEINYVTNVLSNNRLKDIGWAFVFLAVTLQCFMLIVSGIYNLDLRLDQLYYPTILLAVFFTVPIINGHVQKQ